MPGRLGVRVSVIGALVGALWVAGGVAQAGQGFVLPAGQEATIGALLGEGAGALAEGCAFETAEIAGDQVRARYRCGQQQVDLRVVHGSVAPAGATAISDAALVPGPGVPAGLIAAVAGRAGKAKLAWQAVISGSPCAGTELPHWGSERSEDFGVCAPEGAGPGQDPGQEQGLGQGQGQGQGEEPGDGMSPEAEAIYFSTEPMLHEGRYDEIFRLMTDVARREPTSLILGRIVAACAGIASHPTEGNARVDALLADADAHPDDLLKHFIAGVAVHYRGHQHAETPAEKTRDYTLALKHLEQAKASYPHVSRLWLYLAICHYRLGQQAQAEPAINEAVRVDKGTDADIYYSRSEIYHRRDLDKAIADLRTYQQIMIENVKQGAYSAPHKEARVAHMLEHLKAVRRGEVSPDARELFDPIERGPSAEEQGAQPAPAPAPATPPAGHQDLRAGEVHLSPEAEAVYDRSHAQIEAGQVMAAYAAIRAVAVKEPGDLILGRLVVTVARQELTADKVKEFRGLADDNRDDPIAQFVAGIALHYHAHGSTDAPADKARGYADAITYLERAEPSLGHSSRLWLYLAVSHHRLGHADKAREAIDRAFTVDPHGNDPDVFYCRAEIWARGDPARALADLERYLVIMGKNIAEGAIHSPEKQARVQRAVEGLKKVIAGTGSVNDIELFEQPDGGEKR